MSSRPPWPAPGELDRRQREFELHKALTTARQLTERLEMLGDRQRDVAVIRSLRNSLAHDLATLPTPQIVLAADDVDDDGRPNEWNAYWTAQAAGERDDR